MPPRSEIQIDREKLAELLHERSLSQNQFAMYVGVNQAVISRLLSGKQAGVNMRTLMKFAEVLRVQPSDLLMTMPGEEEGEEEDKSTAQFVPEETSQEAIDEIAEIIIQYPELRQLIAELRSDSGGNLDFMRDTLRIAVDMVKNARRARQRTR